VYTTKKDVHFFIGILFAAFFLVGCAVGDVRTDDSKATAVNADTPPTSTLPATPFQSQDAPYPVDISSYIQTAGLTRTESIEWYDPVTKMNRTITDTSTIHTVLAVLVAPASDTLPSVSSGESLLLVFTIPDNLMPRIVSMNYYPATNRITFGNIATSSWPIDVRGEYPFVSGEALLKALGMHTNTTQ